MRILYDASRLMSRAERSAPTGVDRVCLAYAEWLLASPDITTIPVRGRKNRLVAVEIGWFRRFVADLRATWTRLKPLVADVSLRNEVDRGDEQFVLLRLDRNFALERMRKVASAQRLVA